MERLGQRDLDTFLSFLREIYAAPDLESFAARIVLALPKVVPSEWTSYNEVNPQRQTITWVMEPFPSDSSELVQAFAQHIPEHPLINHHQQTRDGRALKISDFLTQSQFHKLELYNEFYRRLEVEHQMAVILPAPAPLVIGIAVNRSSRDFSERDRLLLNLLRSHLIQAYRNAEAITRLRRDLTLMAQALEETDRGVVVLAGDGRVRFCTERARGWISEYFEPSHRADQLPESLRRWVEHQRSLLAKDGDAPPPRKPLVLQRAGKHLVVRLVQDRSEDECLLILEEQPSQFSERSLEPLGLTRREAQVLFWVAQGKTDKEVATHLYVSPRTVKKHLEHVYEKLGVKSRTEAVALALKRFGLY
ncbi:MAG: helix-turn-helix transcriptional regulator [Actinomycetota bacterium]|nr:helix-turn-helix transcriptional regulator [Actinomycetota bacterium]